MTKKPENQLAKADEPLSARFVASVEKNARTAVGMPVKFGPLQRKLCQHLFLKVDQALKLFEAKRLQSGGSKKAPFVWANVNMERLAIDTVSRVDLGLDALIDNHVHPVPYYNGKLQKYDLDLRPGYTGKLYYFRQLSVDPIKSIRVELVHETDKFSPIMKGAGADVESYSFEIPEPFKRGAVIGGFGYIEYENPEKNKLVIVDMSEFDRAKKAAKTDDFWGRDEIKMQYKTIVHRLCKHIQLDPKKINTSFAEAEASDKAGYLDAPEMVRQTTQDAATIDIDPEDMGTPAEGGPPPNWAKEAFPEDFDDEPVDAEFDDSPVTDEEANDQGEAPPEIDEEAQTAKAREMARKRREGGARKPGF